MNTKAKDVDSGGLIIIIMSTQMVCFLLLLLLLLFTNNSNGRIKCSIVIESNRYQTVSYSCQLIINESIKIERCRTS